MPWADSRGVESRYWKLTWHPPLDQLDAAMGFVQDLSPQGFEYEDGQVADSPFTDIPLTAGKPFVRVYLPDNGEPGQLREVREYCRQNSWALEQELVESTDWANAWKAYYRPQIIDRDYVVVPAWYEASPRDASHTLWLDPGMAFGTGIHATTRMCLKILARYEVAGKAILDLGAGSGILGLFAALRGSRRAVLVEPDPVACDAIRHNARLNFLEGRMTLVEGTLSALQPHPFDIVCLNLIWEIIAAEWRRLQSYLAPGALMIVSGLLEAHRRDMEELALSSGNRIVEIEESDGWLAVLVGHDSHIV